MWLSVSMRCWVFLKDWVALMLAMLSGTNVAVFGSPMMTVLRTLLQLVQTYRQQWANRDMKFLVVAGFQHDAALGIYPAHGPSLP